MAFNPSSNIYLCNVPFDNTYQNQIYFPNKQSQATYFANRVKKSFLNYYVVRKVLPSGATQSSVKVEANIDSLYNCNYMFYNNENHGTKWFYAFITNLIYVNENTTEVVFETDVYQTWRFDVELKQSFVVREHCTDDTIGKNTVPEKFNFQDYTYQNAYADDIIGSELGYLIATSEPVVSDETISRGRLMSGVYQGLYFYYTNSPNIINTLLDEVENEVSDCVQCICVIPKFNVATAQSGSSTYLNSTTTPNSKTINIDITDGFDNFSGFKPKNNKLFTAPYFKLVVSNHDGDEAEYNIEDFADTGNIGFTAYGDISLNPSVVLIPNYYKGIAKNYDFGITLNKFPQCAFYSDSYKLWLAKNTPAMMVNGLASIGETALGFVTAGMMPTVGASMVVHGVAGVLNQLTTSYAASKEPNRANKGVANGNILTAIEQNDFKIMFRKIKPNFARTVDDFFTMYGYQTNRVKVPNVSARPYFNYVQTVDVCIAGGIPNDDMNRLKRMYNEGVTLWKHTATVGDYSVDNSPN